MKNELIVNHASIKIETNLSDIKKEVEAIAKQYDVAVTVDNIKEAKALGTELNKMKASIKDVVKSELALLTEPINAFKAEAKEVETILEDARQKLVQGVKVFDDARRLEHKQKIQEFLSFRLNEEKLPEFEDMDITSIISLTGLTASGELNKKSKEDVEAMVSKVKAQALEAQLEAERKAKDDEARIAREVEERVEAQRVKDKAELEAKHKRELEEAKKSTDYKEAPVKQEPAEEANLFTPPPAPAEEPTAEKSVYQINYTFEIKAKAGVNTEAIVAKVNSIFLKEGVEPVAVQCVEHKA